MRFRDGYNGSSFMELLDIEYPHLTPKWDRLFAAAAGELPSVAHGTTVIGLRYAEGAMVAGDRLATMDYRVASRDIEKGLMDRLTSSPIAWE